MYNVKTFVPDGSTPLHTAELAAEEGIESVEVRLCPSDAGTGHHAWEALLVDADRVFDQGEVDEGDLEDVEWEITLEDAGSIRSVSIVDFDEESIGVRGIPDHTGYVWRSHQSVPSGKSHALDPRTPGD